jgi:glycosyltransferase involved in cell wall biosynthesis
MAIKTNNKLAIVVPTKDRPMELARMLDSLCAQTRLPDEVIIVDSGRPPIAPLLDRFRGELAIRYLAVSPPSATRQRNIGIRETRPESSLIALIDDDNVFPPDSLETMMDFWDQAGEDVGGAAFNLLNHPDLYAAGLKSLPFTEWLGLYGREPGRVMPSGFQVLAGTLKNTRDVEWLTTGAAVWRREVFRRFVFDEWYEEYSYLEDLDFSYEVGRFFRLVIVALAGVYHYPGVHGRGSGYAFGRREVFNRLHFVRKHPELSLAKCYLSLLLRVALSLSLAIRDSPAYYFGRAAGNCVALARSFVRFEGKRPTIISSKKPLSR